MFITFSCAIFIQVLFQSTLSYDIQNKTFFKYYRFLCKNLYTCLHFWYVLKKSKYQKNHSKKMQQENKFFDKQWLVPREIQPRSSNRSKSRGESNNQILVQVIIKMCARK